jgi:hypothetical protein
MVEGSLGGEEAGKFSSRYFANFLYFMTFLSFYKAPDI